MNTKFFKGQWLRCVTPCVYLTKGSWYQVREANGTGVLILCNDGKVRYRDNVRFSLASDEPTPDDSHTTALLEAFTK